MWQKKFRFLVLIVLLGSLFLLPSNVSSAELCGSAIPEAGQKFVKIKVTNSDTPSGGQDACISVPENSTTLGFQDLLRVQGPNGAGLVAENWANNIVETHLYRCDVIRAQGGMNAELRPTLNDRPHKNQTLQNIDITFDPIGDCAIQNWETGLIEAWAGRNLNDGRMNQRDQSTPDYPRKERRWKIIFPNETKYIFVLGEQKRNEQNNEMLNICRQQLFQQIPRCNTAANPGLQAFIAANNLQIAFNALGAGTDCETAFRQCVEDLTKGTDVKIDPYKDDPRYKTPAGYEGPLPECSFSYDGCRNVNDILVFFIKIGQTLFQVIGTFAFVMFIYGGFTIILSMGNSEKVKKGQDVLVAAVVGILIAFSAYLIIDFVLNALQVGNDFRSIGGTVQDVE